MPIRSLIKKVARQPARAEVPSGRRVYGVGDIHGRLDLLDELLMAIEADDAGRPPSDTTIIFLGDLIDRGPNSRGVIERLMDYRHRSNAKFLMGNHEQVFLQAVSGDVNALRFLIRIGGRETILSYGVDEADYAQLSFDELSTALRKRVPNEHIAFLSSFDAWVEVGDYLFVHAGVRPGVPLEEQSLREFCWIRGDFLRHRGSFGKVVVHGHSITEQAEVRPNRIGIDTGAFASGRLTAIGLEQDERWVLSTGAGGALTAEALV